MRILCDCLKFQKTAWICSHVIDGFHLQDTIDARRLTVILDPVRRTERLKKRKSPLQAIDMGKIQLTSTLTAQYVSQQIFVPGKLYSFTMAYLYTFYLSMVVLYIKI